MQHGAMGIKVRETEPDCTITQTKDAWLDFYTWLVEYSDQAATEEIGKTVEESLAAIKLIVLSKDREAEHSFTVNKFNAINLYVHCKDFKDEVKDKEIAQVLKTITGKLREFLVGGPNE